MSADCLIKSFKQFSANYSVNQFEAIDFSNKTCANLICQ